MADLECPISFPFLALGSLRPDLDWSKVSAKYQLISSCVRKYESERVTKLLRIRRAGLRCLCVHRYTITLRQTILVPGSFASASLCRRRECRVLLRNLRGFLVLALTSGRGFLEAVFKTLTRSRLDTAGHSAWSERRGSERKVCQFGFWLWTIIR